MKILIVSDKVNVEFYENFDKKRFKDIRLLISCGDLPKYYLNFLVDALDVPCFYVPGNHDSAFEKDPPQGWQTLHRQLVEQDSLLMGGMGGSPLYNHESPYQFTEFQMAFALWRLEWKMRAHAWKNKAESRLDILVTHAPAFSLGDIPGSHVHQGFLAIKHFLEHNQPKLFLYGHTHLNYGVDRVMKYQNTWLVNAYDHFIIDLDNLDALSLFLK